ncbi:hypothetical protein TMatcc_003787, partial [Talaromyces marneffei ATCC 18224]
AIWTTSLEHSPVQAKPAIPLRAVDRQCSGALSSDPIRPPAATLGWYYVCTTSTFMVVTSRSLLQFLIVDVISPPAISVSPGFWYIENHEPSTYHNTTSTNRLSPTRAVEFSSPFRSSTTFIGGHKSLVRPRPTD